MYLLSSLGSIVWRFPSQWCGDSHVRRRPNFQVWCLYARSHSCEGIQDRAACMQWRTLHSETPVRTEKMQNFEYLTRLLLGKSSMFTNMISEITARHEVNDEVEIVTVFKWIMHVYKESKEIKRISLNLNIVQHCVIWNVIQLLRGLSTYLRGIKHQFNVLAASPQYRIRIDNIYLRMVELAEELLFIHDWVHASLGDNPRLCHFLHCE